MLRDVARKLAPTCTRARAAAAYAAQRDDVARVLRDAGYAPRDVDILLATGRDVIGLRARKGRVADGRVGASRLGGLPDLPAGVAWPARDGYMFDFVGQIALADLAALDIHDLLPHDGLLSLFAGHDVTPTSEWQLDVRVAHRSDALTPRDTLAPALGDTGERPRHLRPPKPHGIELVPAYYLPPPWSTWLPELTRTDRYLDVHDAIYQLTGEPRFPLGGLLGFDRPHEHALAVDERMLVRLDAGEAPYAFIESANLCFVIGGDALARWDLTAVRAYEGASI